LEICKNRKPILCIEAKLTDKNCSPIIIYLKKKFPDIKAIKKYSRISIRGAVKFLSEFI
jgi:hypothetical protein